MSENTNCAKCGKKIGFWNLGYDSGDSYLIDDTYNIELDKRFPEHPYKGKKLCRSCYKEIWEKAPSLPQMHPKRKFTISSLMPFALIVLTIIQLISTSWALWMAYTSIGASQELKTSAIAGFVSSLMLIVFLWGVLYYLHKASYSKQEKES